MSQTAPAAKNMPAFTTARVLTMVMLAVAAVQVFLAGMAMFGGEWAFGAHSTLGTWSEVLALLIPVAMLIARPGKALAWLSVGVFVAAALQPALAMLGSATPVGGALHALNAIVVIGLAMMLVTRSGRRSRATV